MRGTIMITADTLAEHAAIGHLRGWCHDSRVCPICDAERKGRAAGTAEAIRSIAEG